MDMLNQANVSALALLTQVLPQTSEAATQEVAIALKNLIDQQAQDIESNANDIELLQQQVQDLPNLQPQERQEVIQLIQQYLPDFAPRYVVNYRGEQVDAIAFANALAEQAQKKPYAVSEVQRSNGRVTSAKLLFDDATEQTVTFARTVSEDGTEATYMGSVPNGVGGLMEGYEAKFRICSLQVPGLSLNSTWDGDLVSHRLVIDSFKISFPSLAESSATPPASEPTNDTPETL